MEFAVTVQNGTAVVETKVDKLNAGNASQLKSELVLLGKKSINNIVIDMQATRYCDSSGLSAILLANRLCKDTNGSFVLCGLQPNVEKLIQISQLDKVLSIEVDQSTALATFTA